MNGNSAFYGWKLLVVVWLVIAVTTGFTYYGGNIMNSYMATEMHLDRKSLGLAFGAFGLCMGFAVPLAGYSVTRWGVRRTVATGATLTGLGALAMALVVSNMLGVVVAFGLVMGVGSSLAGLLPAQTLVTQWFRKRLAMALTLMLTGTITGGFVAAPLFAKVIAAFGGNWRAGWILMAAACALVALCAILFVRNTPAEMGQHIDGAANGDAAVASASSGAKPGVYKTTEDWVFRDVMRHPTWWLMVLGTICFLSAYGMMVGHGVVHFKDLGHSVATAAMFLGLLPLAGLAGKAVVATWGDHVEPRLLWGGAMILMSLGMAVGVTATTPLELYATALLIGAGNAAAYPCMVTLVANYFGRTAYASFMGVMLLLAALATAIGPVLAGVAFDHFGSYALAFYPSATLCLLAGLMMPFVRPPLRRQVALDVAPQI